MEVQASKNSTFGISAPSDQPQKQTQQPTSILILPPNGSINASLHHVQHPMRATSVVKFGAPQQQYSRPISTTRELGMMMPHMEIQAMNCNDNIPLQVVCSSTAHSSLLPPGQVQSTPPRFASSPPPSLIESQATTVSITDSPKSTSCSKVLPTHAACDKKSKHSKKKKKDLPYMGNVKRSDTTPSNGNGNDAPDSPNALFLGVLKHRGYSTNETISALDSHVYNLEPTPLQLASFGTELIKAFHQSDVTKISELLDCGLSPNPCNKFGDSFVYLVCKRANHAILECLVQHGCDLKVCDSFGRTPLHHTAWSSNFNPKVVDIILQQDPLQLLVKDKFGKQPLQYTRNEQWPAWIQYLSSVQDTYWPAGASFTTSKNRKRLVDPENALSVELAKQLSSGSISPQYTMSIDRTSRQQYTESAPLQNSYIFAHDF